MREYTLKAGNHPVRRELASRIYVFADPFGTARRACRIRRLSTACRVMPKTLDT